MRPAALSAASSQASLDPGVCLRVSPDFAAFPALHQRPGHRGHTLLAPVTHVSTLEDLPASLAGPLLRDLRLVAAAVKDAFAASGVSVRLNLGPPGQSVAHLHFHVIPRYLDDEFLSEESLMVPLESRLALSVAFAQALTRADVS